jgi:hypothetical protein
MRYSKTPFIRSLEKATIAPIDPRTAKTGIRSGMEESNEDSPEADRARVSITGYAMPMPRKSRPRTIDLRMVVLSSEGRFPETG